MLNDAEKAAKTGRDRKGTCRPRTGLRTRDAQVLSASNLPIFPKARSSTGPRSTSRTNRTARRCRDGLCDQHRTGQLLERRNACRSLRPANDGLPARTRRTLRHSPLALAKEKEGAQRSCRRVCRKDRPPSAALSARHGRDERQLIAVSGRQFHAAVLVRQRQGLSAPRGRIPHAFHDDEGHDAKRTPASIRSTCRRS